MPSCVQPAAVSYAHGPLAAAVPYESAATTTLNAQAANGGTNYKGYNLGVAVPGFEFLSVR